MFLVKLRGSFVAALAQPTGEQAKGVVPKRVNLDCFSAARGDHPIAHLRIHPGELISFLSLREQAVGWIDMNIKFCSAQMMLGDVDQNWQKKLQRVAVVSAFQITAERVKTPQGCVRSVIHSLLRAVGKHIWNQTVADI